MNRARWQSCTQLYPLLIGRGPEQACEVTVVNGKDLAQSATSFTYNVSLTPLIAQISPRRGSTAGGTSLTVVGSGFRYCLRGHTHHCLFPPEPLRLLSRMPGQC